MGITDLLAGKRDRILAIAASHGARDVRVFGSFARGDATRDSDVDFLVEIEAGRSLLDHAGLIVDLEDLLGRPVDVATPSGLRPHLRARILAEAVPL